MQENAKEKKTIQKLQQENEQQNQDIENYLADIKDLNKQIDALNKKQENLIEAIQRKSER